MQIRSLYHTKGCPTSEGAPQSGVVIPFSEVGHRSLQWDPSAAYKGQSTFIMNPLTLHARLKSEFWKVRQPIVPGLWLGFTGAIALTAMSMVNAATPPDYPSAAEQAIEQNPDADLDDPSEMTPNEIAQKLANPNTPLASLTLRNQWLSWEGDLPGADGIESGIFEFQPAFPFPVDESTVVSFRPSFSYLVDQPVWNPSSGRVETQSGFGDMGFDLAYGINSPSGLLARVGMSGSIPIGSDGLSSETWALGPEMFLGVKKDYGVFGIFPSQLWDVSGPTPVNLTTIQPVVVFLPGNAWGVGSSPIMSYDWNAEQWTIPLQLVASKTIKAGDIPLRLSLEVNYYLDKPGSLGQEWMVAFNITPVLPNIFAKMMGLGD